MFREFACETDVGFEVIQVGTLIAHVIAAGVVIPVFDFDLYGGDTRMVVNVFPVVGGEHPECAKRTREFQGNDGFSVFLSFEAG